VAVVQDVTERKRLEKEILAISEREKTRIGNDLHDGLCQKLVGAALVTNMLEEQLKKKSIAEVSDVRQIAALLDDAITEARTIAGGLHPVTLDAEGLAFALRELAINVSRVSGISCQLDSPLPVLVADHAVATHLYRIAQEAVNNAIKHGHATKISIELTSAAENLVTLKIADNGIGLAAPPNRSGGMGTAIMRYRADMIGGTLEVKSGPGRGTTIVCQFRQESVT
jgi:signal transduction histidine kinase